MKKGLKLFSLLLGSTFVLAGCNEFSSGWPEKLPSADEMCIDTPWTDYTVPCTSITFAKGEANLDLLKGETHTYSYSVEPKDFNSSLLVWESDNPAVATVENGVLTAVGGGKANISLSYGDIMARSLVNVNVPITDFNVLNKEVSLDIEGTSQITCELSPADTTQNAIHYETESSIISVSDSGLISALGSAGDAEVKVTSEALNKVEVINVHVSDMWNYVSSLTLSGPEKLEVNKVDALSSSVVAIDPSKEASTLAHNKVVYSVKEGSEAYVSVDAETGNITGLEPGTATLVATLHEERSNTDKVDEFDVEVFEVSATAISLNETGTIELDNNENLSRLLSYTYTLSDTSFDAPSRGNVTFTSSDVNVAKVNDDGLVEVVGPGSATITVKDTTYNVSDTVDVHTTIYAKSVVLAGGVDFYLDEDVEITANVTPANTTDPLVWDYDTTTGHDFVEGGNKLIVTCNNLDNPVEVKASVGGVTSNVITLTPKEREVAFESGKTYIVGSSNFKSGISKDVDGGSWNAAKYAFIMTDKTGNAHAKYEYKATIEFRANDLWKIRENEADWRDLDTTLGRYKLNEGAFAKGQMVRSSEEADANVLVKEAGKYDVYYAYYDDTETGWYEVYVEEHGMKVSTTSVHAKLSDTVVPSVINASNYDGTLCVSEVDENYISVSVDQLTGNITITPKAVGETLFKVSDDYKEVVINVEIKEGSIVVGTDYYVRGTAVGTWDAVEANVLGVSADANNIGEILDVYFAVGDFKIGNADWTVQWGYEYDGHTTVNGGAASKFSAGESDNNIHCNVAGYYNVYLTNNNYIYIESVGGDTPVDLSSLYIRGDAVGSWEPLPENQMTVGTDNNKAVMLNFEMSVGEFKIANADWSLSWGYDYDGHATIIGGAAANFAAGEKDNNISCNVAGTYNIYLTNNNYISIEIAGEPIPPEPDPIYAYVLNNGEPVLLTEGTDDEGNPQLEALNVEMKAGESIFFENTAKEPAEVLTSLKPGEDDTTVACEFNNDEGVLTASHDGTFSFYVKLSSGNDIVYISEAEGPAPVDLTSIYIRGEAVGSWEPIDDNKMSAGTDNDRAVMLGVEMTVGEFKIGNADWSLCWGYKYANPGEDEHVTIQGGAKDNFSEGTSEGNIKCDVAGKYNIYLTNNNYIYVENAAFALSASSVTIEQGETFEVTASNLTGALSYRVTHGTAVVVIEGNKATLSSSVIGMSKIEFSDESGDDPITFTLTVTEPVAKHRYYIETKSWFNSGAENEQVYVYAYKEDSNPIKENAAFPGEEATWVKDLDEGKKLFYFDVAESYDAFIVSKLVDGTKTYQTNNVVISGLSGDNCVYMMDQPDNVETKVEIGHYNYVLGLSQSEATIGVGNSVNVTLNNTIGDVSYVVSPEGSATVAIEGNVATITSSTIGASLITFSDESSSPDVTFTLTVQEAPTNKRVYFETKSWFNSGAENEQVYVYAYNSSTGDKNNDFPGEYATWLKDIESGKKIFYFDVSSEYDVIIFVKVVDGSVTSQTVDISLSQMGSNNCVYLSSDTYQATNAGVGYYTLTV